MGAKTSDLYLLRQYERRINQLLRDREHTATLLQSVTAAYDRVPVQGGGTGDSKLDAYERLWAQDKEIDQLIDTLVDLKEWINHVIDRIDDPLWAEVLSMRHIGRMRPPKIAECLCYSESHVRRSLAMAEEEYDRLSAALKDERNERK